MYSLSNCGCGCSDCHQSVTANVPCTNNKCRATLESTSIGSLVWMQGLDANLCEKFQRISDTIGLRDCLGNRITLETPLVTCADFRNQLCSALLQLAYGGPANAATLLVGADCKLYTLPVTTPGIETPNGVIDTTTIDFSATGTLGRIISGDVNISDDSGNLIEVRSDGLYASFTAPSVPTACQQIQAFEANGDAIAGTVLVGADCRKYTYNPPVPPGFTITDTASIDLTLSGTNLSGNVRLDPNFIGRITPDGLELTCADVLACAPAVTVIDTTTVDLAITGQQIQGDVKISTVPGNNIEVKPDGLYVSVCAALDDGPVATPATPGVTELVGADCNRYTLPTGTNLTVTDTNTVNHTLVGNNLQSSVIVAPSTLITAGPFGLQVLCEDIQDCVFNIPNNFWTYNDLGNSVAFAPSGDTGNQLGLGSDGRPFVPAATDQITVTDTSCINLTITDGNISAVPIISPQAGNILSCENDGLYAAATIDIGITGQDTNCIDIGVTEATPNNFVITAVPVISSDLGNSLECRVTGLYAPLSGSTPLSVVGVDTDCIDITVVEAPLGTFNVSVDPIISAVPDNQIQCTVGGLYVPRTDVQSLDSQCIDVTVTEEPAQTFTISASPIIDPDPCNEIECRTGGLYAPQSSSGIGNVTGPALIDPPAPIVGIFVSNTECVNIANTSDCRSTSVMISYRMPYLDITANGGVPYEVLLELEYLYNIPTVAVFPFTLLNSCRLSGGVADNQRSPDTDIQEVITLPIAAAGQICVRTRVTVVAGTPIVGVGAARISYIQVTQ